MLRTTIGRTVVRLIQGDITLQDTDAIVNAANSGLLGGGGVDGAIHRAGGSAIMKECSVIREKHGGCPTGEAVLTTGGNLKARHVIHAVGPVWRGGTKNEDRLLASAYQNSLRLALENAIRSVAFPSISTGVYGFPIERASRIAFSAVQAALEPGVPLDEIRFIVFSQQDYEVYKPFFLPDSTSAPSSS